MENKEKRGLRESGQGLGGHWIDNLITRDPLFVRFRTRVVQRYSRTIFIVRWLTTATYIHVRDLHPFSSLLFSFFFLFIEKKKRWKIAFVQSVVLSFQKVKAVDDEITCFILVAETILLETNNIEMQIRIVKTGKSNERIKICNVAMRYIKEEKYKNTN